MGFLQRIKDKIPYHRKPEDRSSFQKFIRDHKWVIEPKQKNKRGFETLYKAAENVWIDSVINITTNTVLTLNWDTRNVDTDVSIQSSEDLYAKNLLKRPMGYGSSMTFQRLIGLILRSFLITGDAFVEAVSNDGGELIGFNFIPPHYMMYDIEKEQFQLRYDPNTYFDEDQLLHFYEAPVDGNVWGKSKIETLAADLTLDLLARGYSKDILKHSGLNPQGVIEFDSDLPEDEYFNELKRLNSQAEDPNVRNGTLLLRGAKYNDIGYSPKEMSYESLLNSVRDRVLAIYAVPPSKISIIETASLGSGTGESQNENFKKVISGYTNILSSEFNRIFNAYGFETELYWDELDIEDKSERANIENLQLNNGLRTINEVRESYGLEPVLWGDEPLVKSGFSDVLDSQGANAVEVAVKDLEESYKW